MLVKHAVMSATQRSVNLRLETDTHERLKAAAEEDGNSINTEISHAVTDFLERRQTRKVMERVKATMARDSSLLARLAE